MAGRSRERHKAFFKLFLWTVALLISISGLNALFIINSLGDGFFKKAKREIASATPSFEIEKVKLNTSIVEVDCRKKAEPLTFKTKAISTRIQFINCKDLKRLVNETNHFQGDIFPLQKGQWTSDFIALNPGENQIKVPFDDLVQVIKITREVPEKSAQQKAL